MAHQLMPSDCSCPSILVEECPLKTLVTLNRPETLNSLTLEMVRTIANQLKKCDSPKSMVIVRGTGERSFCAGGDVRIIVKSGATNESKSFFKEEYTLNNLIRNCKFPYVTLIDGITMGGGVGLAVHGKYCVATERTVLAMPETAIGLFPDVGGTYFLPRLDGKLGLYLGLTGHRLKGADVMKAGMATHYCDSSKLSQLESALLQCSDPSEVPDILNSYSTDPSEQFALSPHMDVINKCFAGSSVEEIFHNLEQDGSEWALRTISTLRHMSPLSLKLTFRALEEGAKLSLAECLAMEYRIVVRCLENSDFQEGVRALLIDKDKNPHWNPENLESVTDEKVAEYFKHLPDSEELKL